MPAKHTPRVNYFLPTNNDYLFRLNDLDPRQETNVYCTPPPHSTVPRNQRGLGVPCRCLVRSDLNSPRVHPLNFCHVGQIEIKTSEIKLKRSNVSFFFYLVCLNGPELGKQPSGVNLLYAVLCCLEVFSVLRPCFDQHHLYSTSMAITRCRALTGQSQAPTPLIAPLC